MSRCEEAMMNLVKDYNLRKGTSVPKKRKGRSEMKEGAFGKKGRSNLQDKP